MSILPHAFRNLGRHRVKTVITVTAVAFGVLAYLYMDAFLAGSNTESRRNLLNYEMGAATIYSKSYWAKHEELPLYEGFGDYGPIISRLNESGYEAAPRAAFVGTLLSRKEELPFVFTGVVPSIERRVFRYESYIERDGGAHPLRNGSFEILLGVRGARDLNVKPGDAVRLSTVIDKRDEAGRMRHINQVVDLVVAGVLNSPDPVVNSYVGYLPLDILEGELGILLEGKITEIIVRKAGAREYEPAATFESPEVITANLGEVLPDSLTVVGWKDRAADYIAASTSDAVQSVVFLGFFFIIVLLVIANTVLMAVLERTREIGMLRALGMEDGAIVGLFLVETGLIGFFGAVVGILFFLPLNHFMVTTGIDYSQMMSASGIDYLGYRVTGAFKSIWNYGTMAGCAMAAPLLATITAIIPARRAIRMTITDALHFE